MSPTFRRRLLEFHTWTGLTMGIVIVFLAVTGAGFVLRPQLDHVVNRDLLVVPACEARLPADDLMARAQAVHPGRVRAIETDVEEGASTGILFDDRDYVYVNPCTGAILGSQNTYGGFFGTLDGLHRFRFMQTIGKDIAGWCTVGFLLLLIIGGIILWWPRTWLVFKSAIKFNHRLPGTARTLSLHKVVGLYSSLLLLLIAFTGVMIAFVPLQRAIYAAFGGIPDKNVIAPNHGDLKPLSFEQLWTRAKAVVPDQEWVSIRLPVGATDPVEFEIRERTSPHEDAKSYVYLDAYTGEVLRTIRYATDVSLGRKIYLYMIVLHSGLVGGLPLQIALLLAALAIPVQAYSGVSPWLRRKFAAPKVAPTFQVRVEKIRDEASDVKSFRLVPLAKSLPGFAPGAHINVTCEEGVVRQYSLCNDCSEKGSYLIAVKRIPASRGGSEAMHDRVDEGDVLAISGPRNHFPLDLSAKHHLLIAGGIGITPLLSMARYLQRAGASFSLQYFTRSIEQTAFHDELSQPAFRGKVAFHYAVEPERVREYLHKLLWARPEGAHLYICGPRPFMDLVEEIAGATWPPESIHIEYFTADPLASAGPREPFDITLARSGGTYTVPAEKTIVQVLAEQGIDNLTSCEQGVCGTCLCGVLEGEPDHRDAFLSEPERKANSKMLICVSRAKSKSLVLDL